MLPARRRFQFVSAMPGLSGANAAVGGTLNAQLSCVMDATSTPDPSFGAPRGFMPTDNRHVCSVFVTVPGNGTSGRVVGERQSASNPQMTAETRVWPAAARRANIDAPVTAIAAPATVYMAMTSRLPTMSHEPK